MVKVFQAAGKLKSNPACKSPCLDAGTVITEADLQAGLKMYNVTLREADAVFINTGWGDLFQQWPAQNATYNRGEPGISKAAAEWLASQKVVAVGADTWAVEVIPGEEENIAFPVHKMLLTDNGIHIIENVRTDLIAAAAAKTGRATFFLNHDGAEGGRPDRHLRQHRGDSVADDAGAGAAAPAVPGRTARLRPRSRSAAGPRRGASGSLSPISMRRRA